MSIRRLRWTTLREAVGILVDRKGGCFHYPIWDDGENDWAIVIGFMEDGSSDPEFFDDGKGYGLYYKIAYQSKNSVMQCDFDVDWTMPFDEKTGEVVDSCSPVWRPATPKGWQILAYEINDTAARIVEYEIDRRRKTKDKEV